jgi:major membrane immunogen (membrane-anchored lipoprotein)
MNRQNISFPVVCVVIILFASSFSSMKERYPEETFVQDTIVKYRDGIYTGQSQSVYVDEPYWGKVSIKVEKGSLTRVNFIIRDSSLHETFDGKYKKHFKGNAEYIQQCKNDWDGVKMYPKLLKERQDINKVDASTGATWSYNIFKAATVEAMQNPAKK